MRISIIKCFLFSWGTFALLVGMSVGLVPLATASQVDFVCHLLAVAGLLTCPLFAGIFTWALMGYQKSKRNLPARNKRK